MARKLVALLLVASMLLCMFSGCASKQEAVTTLEIDGYSITVKEDKTKREASTTIEGISLSCEHIFDTQEYWLYINEEPIELAVTVLEDGFLEVYLADEIDTTNLDEVVIPQMAMTSSIAAPYLIDFAIYLISLSALGYYASNVAVSADSVGTVIGGIRSDTKTYKRYRTVDISAADAIRYGRIKKSDAYYEAYLKGNTVMISRGISEYSAVRRLETGRDVFATSAYAASWACLKASTTRGTLPNHTDSREGYYPHFHPLGRRWINNRNYAPHCWYPY